MQGRAAPEPQARRSVGPTRHKVLPPVQTLPQASLQQGLSQCQRLLRARTTKPIALDIAFYEYVAYKVEEGLRDKGAALRKKKLEKDPAALTQGFRNQAHYSALLREYANTKRLGKGRPNKNKPDFHNGGSICFSVFLTKGRGV